jgi:hypothetical protein
LRKKCQFAVAAATTTANGVANVLRPDAEVQAKIDALKESFLNTYENAALRNMADVLIIT